MLTGNQLIQLIQQKIAELDAIPTPSPENRTIDDVLRRKQLRLHRRILQHLRDVRDRPQDYDESDP